MQNKSEDGQSMPAEVENTRHMPGDSAGAENFSHNRDENFCAGDVVWSTAGRDAGLVFFVLEAGGGYVSLADGRHRKVQKPKRKKQKHIMHAAAGEIIAAEAARCANEILGAKTLRGGKLPSDRAIWRALRTYRERSTATADNQTQALREVY